MVPTGHWERDDELDMYCAQGFLNSAFYALSALREQNIY